MGIERETEPANPIQLAECGEKMTIWTREVVGWRDGVDVKLERYSRCKVAYLFTGEGG